MLFLTIFFAILLVKENAKLKFAFVISTGAPITVANEAIEMLPLVALFTHSFSFANFSNKILFNFIDSI